MAVRRKKRILPFAKNNFFQAGIVFGLLFLFLIAAGARSLLKDLPGPEAFETRIVKQSTKIFDRAGEVLLYEIHGEERRTVIPFAEIPQAVKSATLAAEDANFYQHPAFDLRAIFRAVLHNLFSRDGSIQGGSTITQQLVKKALLSDERTIRRKIRELILAIRFERQYSKDEILGFYLNQIPYGSNAYGIEAASQTFFAKKTSELTLAEAALLAGLPKAPSYFSPYGSHTDELKARQEYILERMASLSLITKEEAEKAKAQNLRFAPQSYGIRAPHFVFFVRQLLDESFGEENVESGGLRVLTTLDWRAQEIAEKVVSEGARANDTNWKADNAALVAQDAKTGEILAMVGSRDYFDLERQGNVNVSTRVRQPGSAFKPFVYAAAFKKGYTPETVTFDVPTEFVPSHPRCPALVDFSNDFADCYHPQNYDEKFRGPVTFRKALAQSLNVPSVKVLYLAGVPNSIQTARDFGITTLTEPAEHYGLSLVLGGGGVKLLEMVGAYSAFAQDGILRSQQAILKVEDASGKILFEARSEQKRVIEPQYARLINDILSDDASRVPAFQPGGPLTLRERKVASKTGTSQDYRDAWVIGYTPSLVAGVWVGNNDNRPMIKGGAGVMAAAPIWHAFMEEYLAGAPAEDFTPADPIIVQKPALRGEYLIDLGTGPQIHDILFWAQRENPQGPMPENPTADPQFANWEAGVTRWLQQNFPDWQRYQNTPSATFRPVISILEPKEGETVSGQALEVLARVESNRAIQEVSIFFNQRLIITFDGNPDNLYSVYFIPQNWQAENEIKLQAIDDRGVVTTKSTVIRR
jgi:1A family penicillin-binding protein